MASSRLHYGTAGTAEFVKHSPIAVQEGSTRLTVSPKGLAGNVGGSVHDSVGNEWTEGTAAIFSGRADKHKVTEFSRRRSVHVDLVPLVLLGEPSDHVQAVIRFCSDAIEINERR